MKHFLIFLIVLILQTAPAKADQTCSPQITQAALEQIKILNKKLVKIPPSATLEWDIAPEAKLPMGLLNEAFKQWMTAELKCQPSGNFDQTKFNTHIQEAIEPVIAEKPAPREYETHYGLNWVKLQFDPSKQLLLITTSQDIPCTDDMALIGYRVDKDSWVKVVDISTDYSAEDPISYRFKEPAFIKDQGNGHNDILLTNIPGQCNGMWYGFDFIVIDPAPYGRSKKIFTLEKMYFNGELTDDGGPTLKIQKNRFQLSWYAPDFSDHGPGEPVRPDTVIKTYELRNGNVRTVKSLK